MGKTSFMEGVSLTKQYEAARGFPIQMSVLPCLQSQLTNCQGWVEGLSLSLDTALHIC